MLRSLRIEKFAIIDELEVEFGDGLNIITGETGAGKTIVVQALNLVLGDRASSDLIRSGEDKATVTAVFSLDGASSDLRDQLTNIGVNTDDDVIIHRIVSATGKGKIAINGVAATSQMLRSIAECLVDVSSQHEHQLLLDPSAHCSIVDQFGVLEDMRNEYLEAHQKYSSLKEKLDRLLSQEKEAKERLDFIKYQLKELKGANLKMGEDEELEAERMRLKHAVQLETKVREAEESLYGAHSSVTERLGKVHQSITSCAQIDATLAPWSEAIERASSELEDLSRELKRYVDKLNSDPNRLELIEERLHFLKNLKRKHGGTIESCIKKQEELREEVEKVENYDECVAQKEKTLASAATIRKDIAERLSEKRKRVASELTRSVEKELQGLSLGKIRFVASIKELPQEKWGAEGKDEIEFLIAPNVGEELRPLVKIASGGELSRIMLAIKRILTDKAKLARTSIFDEVDSGIGGATAEVVGKKLSEVARSRQVVCITHLPQIACFGERHLTVRKKVVKGRTLAEGEPLTKEARVDELSRMLGGTKITETTRKHAEEILKQAKSL